MGRVTVEGGERYLVLLISLDLSPSGFRHLTGENDCEGECVGAAVLGCGVIVGVDDVLVSIVTHVVVPGYGCRERGLAGRSPVVGGESNVGWGSGL